MQEEEVQSCPACNIFWGQGGVGWVLVWIDIPSETLQCPQCHLCAYYKFSPTSSFIIIIIIFVIKIAIIAIAIASMKRIKK